MSLEKPKCHWCGSSELNTRFTFRRGTSKGKIKRQTVCASCNTAYFTIEVDRKTAIKEIKGGLRK